MLNQKSELQRALEKQREAASRREAERNREENYKDDPRTALQRAIEQRAKHIEVAVSFIVREQSSSEVFDICVVFNAGVSNPLSRTLSGRLTIQFAH